MHKPRLLILDEDRIILQSLGQFLRREGYEVRATDSPDDASALMEAGQVDVLLADVNIPGVKPAEFLRDLRRKHPNVVLVVVTSYGSIEGAVDATKMGAFDYLTKPIVDEEIRVVVEKAARQQALLSENRSLKSQLDQRFGLESVVGRDHKMLKIFDLVTAAADSRTTVLMTGESGTGKSLLARAIHHRSPRRDKPFVEVSCGALPETLLESELFGHLKGSFTGAIADKPGRFMAADGGTIFLDEINSASPAMQVKLLRVLQERTFEPVGGTEPKTVDVRVLLATNVDLAQLVAEKAFRLDLYYRINVLNVKMPPLRDRPGDVALLATHFLRKLSADAGREVVGFSDAAMSAMLRYAWPGNVRELENAVERAVLLCRRPQVDVDDLPETVQGVATSPVPSPALSLEPSVMTSSVMTPVGSTVGQDVVGDPIVLHRPMPLAEALEIPERRIIEAALKRNNWNRQATATELDINRTTLYKKMRKFGMLGVGEVA